MQIWAKALGVNPNSKNMKAAYALAAWLGSAEMQALHYELRDGGVVPCNTELLASDEFSSNPAASCVLRGQGKRLRY